MSVSTSLLGETVCARDDQSVIGEVVAVELATWSGGSSFSWVILVKRSDGTMFSMRANDAKVLS